MPDKFPLIQITDQGMRVWNGGRIVLGDDGGCEVLATTRLRHDINDIRFVRTQPRWSNTDRGLALLEACAAMRRGDILQLGPLNYDLGEASAPHSSATVIAGMGAARSVVTSALKLVPGLNSTIAMGSDAHLFGVKVRATAGFGFGGSCLGCQADSRVFTNALVEDCILEGTSDAIDFRHNVGLCSITVRRTGLFSNFDTLANNGNGDLTATFEDCDSYPDEAGAGWGIAQCIQLSGPGSCQVTWRRGKMRPKAGTLAALKIGLTAVLSNVTIEDAEIYGTSGVLENENLIYADAGVVTIKRGSFAHTGGNASARHVYIDGEGEVTLVGAIAGYEPERAVLEVGATGSISYTGEAKGRSRAYTASANLTHAQAGLLATNAGAAGAVKLTLPAATHLGEEFHFACEAAQAFRVAPQAGEVITNPGTGAPLVAGKYLQTSTVGNSFSVKCTAVGVWRAIGAGTYSSEA